MSDNSGQNGWTPDQPMVSIKNLHKSFGELEVLKGVTFDVMKSEVICVIGPSGSGKSTLLRAMAGLLPVAGGKIAFDDPEGEFGDAQLPELCHYLGHENAMKASMSVGENLQFWQEFAGQAHLDVEDALDMVGLGGLSSIPFPHLSTGQRRRASIARLLVSYRPVWILDEPTAGLDASSEKQFGALMQAHLDDDGMIIAATHVPLGLKGAREIDLQEIARSAAL